MKFVIIAVVGWACHLVAAQEKVCSTFCSSLGMLQTNPGKSCNDIYQINKASRGAFDNYWINTTTGVHQVYCDMELECGGHKGGWMRIADFDINRGDDCLSGWNKITTPVPACIAPSNDAGCYSTNFLILSAPYSKVCGMSIGYHEASCDGFVAATDHSINGPYVDDISITYGNPRKHLWSNAIGRCPCKGSGFLPPSFVHDDYYCESGTGGSFDGSRVNRDPVWDGKDCPDESSCFLSLTYRGSSDKYH